ncbi:MAG TPA: glycine dehydrogenase subunit 2 [Planctomycetes bacterium]|nr:glycine dehydrogenase subunit 2 [Planctomycetota bacterium]HIL52013.1 glycine dehydrogenase subunit 2 [Planctomycetota bacterium]
MNKDLLLFEKSRPGRRTLRLGELDVPAARLDALPAGSLRETPPKLPEIGELELVRHFVRLSKKNVSIADSFYPLGSCTMKYNPLLNESAAAIEGFRDIHPLQDPGRLQGALAIMKRLEETLAAITGLEAVTLHPAAGAQGELAALLVAHKHFARMGQSQRTKVLIPDSAHGTNPASASLAGLTALEVKSGPDGLVDLADLESKLGADTAVFMITNPSTLGLFETNIARISELVHAAGGLVYMDGANMNAIMGIARPVDFGVDMMHLNLHKTFSTPHGGGGPGAGPICVTAELEPYLPAPRIVENDSGLHLDYDIPHSIGMLRGFAGNFGVLLRAYCYLRRLGAEGIQRVAENAVLNANYLRVKLRDAYHVPFDSICMHEFVCNNRNQREQGVHTLDIAKRLIDMGHHPMTIYFPLVVNEAMMIEPTETEAKETLDAFIEDMLQVAREAEENPERLHAAPCTTPVGRLDEGRAVREPILRYNFSD